jgi:hypothetical protein
VHNTFLEENPLALQYSFSCLVLVSSRRKLILNIFAFYHTRGSHSRIYVLLSSSLRKSLSLSLSLLELLSVRVTQLFSLSFFFCRLTLFDKRFKFRWDSPHKSPVKSHLGISGCIDSQNTFSFQMKEEGLNEEKKESHLTFTASWKRRIVFLLGTKKSSSP